MGGCLADHSLVSPLSVNPIYFRYIFDFEIGKSKRRIKIFPLVGFSPFIIFREGLSIGSLVSPPSPTFQLQQIHYICIIYINIYFIFHI